MSLMMELKLEPSLVLDAQTASDLMVANPVSLRADASVAEAMRLFAEKGITAAPVIDPAGRPIGVISRSDLMIHEIENQKRRASQPASTSGAAKPVTVSELMTPAVFAASPETSVARLIGDMVGLHVHRMFVVDDAGVLVGVVSAMDVLRQLKANQD